MLWFPFLRHVRNFPVRGCDVPRSGRRIQRMRCLWWLVLVPQLLGRLRRCQIPQRARSFQVQLSVCPRRGWLVQVLGFQHLPRARRNLLQGWSFLRRVCKCPLWKSHPRQVFPTILLVSYFPLHVLPFQKLCCCSPQRGRPRHFLHFHVLPHGLLSPRPCWTSPPHVHQWTDPL